jgi:hypothetical protein
MRIAVRLPIYHPVRSALSIAAPFGLALMGWASAIHVASLGGLDRLLIVLRGVFRDLWLLLWPYMDWSFHVGTSKWATLACRSYYQSSYLL